VCVYRTCTRSAPKCSSCLCLRRVAGLCSAPRALGERQGESSLAWASRAPGAPRARLAELSAAGSGLGLGLGGRGWTLGFCVPAAAVGWRAPNPGACRLSLASTHGDRRLWWQGLAPGCPQKPGFGRGSGRKGLQLREPGPPQAGREGRERASERVAWLRCSCAVWRTCCSAAAASCGT
jgi:hypothetical protein